MMSRNSRFTPMSSKDLGVGEAIMIVPHERGAKTVRIKFSKTDDLEPEVMPQIAKTIMPLLEEMELKPKVQSDKVNSALENAA